jgi:hypothetical protein
MLLGAEIRLDLLRRAGVVEDDDDQPPIAAAVDLEGRAAQVGHRLGLEPKPSDCAVALLQTFGRLLRQPPCLPRSVVRCCLAALDLHDDRKVSDDDQSVTHLTHS